MKPITEKRCRNCGGEIKRSGVDLGYSTAKELDRPVGAKGRDEYAVIDACVDCGGVDWDWQSSPCHICGEGGKRGILLIDFAQQVTGIGDWVPGLPNEVNLCNKSECWHTLAKEVDKKMEEALNDGAFE